MTTDFTQIAHHMHERGDSPEQINGFQELYQRWCERPAQPLDWNKISTPDPESIVNYEDLDEVSDEEAKRLLRELAVCRLNGGLGTSMGMVGPKSAIEVRDGNTFLDLIVNQIQLLNQKYQADVPLVLMNSFNTTEDTNKIIKRYFGNLTIHSFEQNRFPRLRRDSLMPMSATKHGRQAYYPPGHGDFYKSIYQSGIVDKLLEQGRKYMFVSNADNLGASFDVKILKKIKQSGAPFVMEVTVKTRSDVKGGTLVSNGGGSLSLLEIAQVPRAYKEEFKSFKKFKIFNTNNVWLDLEIFKKTMLDGGLNLDVIVNPKVVNHVPVIQLETAIGAAIGSFEGSLAIKVPRHRFLPVKRTDDLLLVQSNLFILEDGVLVRNPERQFDYLPMVRLGDAYKYYEEYQSRFENIPDILELDLLTVVGDIRFGKNVTLRGNVILVCEEGSLYLPDNSFIENKVLTGSISVGEL
jgi:UTP--glucose-1-phosphate uridylyltransferase